MQRLLLFCLLLLLPFRMLRAQSIDTLFVQIPDTAVALMELLPTNSRLDMIDLYNYGMPAQGETLFGDKISMTEKTPNTVRLSLSPACRWELRRWQYRGRPVYGVIETLCLPEEESYGCFYDDRWKSIDLLDVSVEGFSPFHTDSAFSSLSSYALTFADFRKASATDDAAWQRLTARLLRTALQMSWLPEADAPCPTLRLQLSTAHLDNDLRTLADTLLTPLFLRWDETGFSLVRP